MNLLLDTHALLWILKNDARLSGVAASAMADVRNRRYVSDVSAWEIAMKLSSGKLTLPIAFEQLFPGGLLARGFRILPISHKHMAALLEMPLHHRDPFDRLLIAQAQVEGMTLLTSDSHLKPYGVRLLW